MSDNDLRQLLEKVEIEPSARCWEAIEGNLAAGAGATAGKAVANKGIVGATSAATKAIIGSVIGVAVAGAIITAVVLSDKDSAGTNDKVVATTEQITKVKSEESNERTTTTEATNTVAFPNDSRGEELLPSPTNNTPSLPSTVTGATTQPAVPQQLASTSSTASPAPTSAPTTAISPKSTISAPNHPKTSSTSATSKPQTSTTHTSTVAQTEDPVLMSHDEIGYTQPISIEIPNVFTPNGDGFNDVFIIKGIENCEKSRLIIKSRAGKVILQTSDYQNNWNADNVPDGTYFYQFSYTVNGISQTRNGTLTIMR